MPKKNTLATLGETPTSDETYPLPQQQPFAAPALPPLDLGLMSPDYATPSAVPRVSGAVTLPLLGNELQLRGDYLRNPYGGASDWMLGLGLRRQF